MRLPFQPKPGRAAAVLVIALGTRAHAQPTFVQPRGEIGRPITLPGDSRPPRPAGGMPKSCLVLQYRNVAHWERQNTLLSRLLTVGGADLRVANARATLVARRDLGRLDLAAFAAEPQAVGEVTLNEPHNGLRAGRYCLVSTLDRQGLTANPNDRRWWHMFLYDMNNAQAPAAAYVPFIYRADPRSRPAEHPANAPLSPLPARFELTLRREYAQSSGPPGREPLDLAFAQLQRDWLAMATWYMCAEGCCTGGVEALQTY